MKRRDDNIGDGKFNYLGHDGQIRTLNTIDKDRRLNALCRQLDNIEGLLNETGKDTVTFIKELYFKTYPEFTMDGSIANQPIYVSHTKAFKLRKEFVDGLAKRFGLWDI